MADSDYSVRSRLRYDTPSSRGRSTTRRARNVSSTPINLRLKSAEKYLNSVSREEDTTGLDIDRYSRSSSPLLLREKMKAESQIRAERDADLKTLRRSISPKRPKSPTSKSPRERSTSPIPLKYSNYSHVSTPYEEYRSAISSLRNLRDNPTYQRSVSPPAKEIPDREDISATNLGSSRILSGGTLDSGIGGNKYDVIDATVNFSTNNLNKSPLGTLKSPTWHKLDKDGLQDAVEESEQRRMLLVNRLKDAQDTLKLQASTITSIKSEKERLKLELDSLNFSKEESYNEKRNLTTRIKLMKSKCDELDEEVAELRRTSESFKQKMEEKTKLLQQRNETINELENELSAIRLSSADNGDQISKLQDSYNRARTQASLLEQQHTNMLDENSDLKQDNGVLEKRSRELKTMLEEAEMAITQLKGDLAISERERRELEEERRTVISHKLDTQEALTKSNQVNMELQGQIDTLIELRDNLEKDNQRLGDKVSAMEGTLSSRDVETSNKMAELEALQRENHTLRDINDNLKDRLDDAERSKSDAEHVIAILRDEKQDLLDQKSDVLNNNEELQEDLKVAKIELGDRKHENEMLFEEKEDERKEKQQLQEMLDTLKHDSETQKNYLETQCDDLEKDIQRLQSEVSHKNDENKLISKELVQLKNEASYNKNKAEEWKNTAQSLEDSLNLSENERKGVVEDLLRIQNELTDLKDDYSVVADERNRFLDKYQELQADCENLQEEVRELLLEKDENQHVLRLLETQKHILEEKWNGGKDLDAAQTECIELREDVKACRDRVKDLEQQCDNLKNELQIATEKVTNLQGEKKRAQENIGRADKTIELLTNDKDRLQKQVQAVTREFERRVATLEEELDAEQQKVLRKAGDNAGLKKRLDEALNSHGTEKTDLLKEKNELEDKITTLDRIQQDLDKTVQNKNGVIQQLEAARDHKNTKEAKLADALKAITGNPDVEDPYVQAAEFMKTVKKEKEGFEKEAATIPGHLNTIQKLQAKLDAAQKSNSERGSDIELKSASIDNLENAKSQLEDNVSSLQKNKKELESQLAVLVEEKKRLDKLEVDHANLTKDHNDTLENLTESKKECIKTIDERDNMDNENKRVKAENAKLSMDLADLKKALASKGNGEKAMLEASNELRIVRDELEDLMGLITTKDEKIQELNFELEEMSNKISLLKDESKGKSEEIKALRSQLRDADRKLERTGDLDLDASAVVWEKDEHVKRLEKWIENYKEKIEALEKQRCESEDERASLKDEKKALEKKIRELQETVEGLESEIDVMKEVLMETEAEREAMDLQHQELLDTLENQDPQAKDEIIRKLHQTEDELRMTKQKLQMLEDDKRQLAGYDIKDLKTPEEVAKIIEDIKEAFEDEIAELLLSEREQYEKEKSNFEKEKDDFRFEQEEFLRQAEEIASEQMNKKSDKMNEMQTQLDTALSELQKYKSGS